MLVLEGLVGLHRAVQLPLLQQYWSGHRFGICDIEWFALEMNRDHCVIFETAPKYCIFLVYLFIYFTLQYCIGFAIH